MSDNTPTKYPEPGSTERAIKGARFATSFFPFSGPFLELAALLPDRLTERRVEFFNRLASDLHEMQQKVEGFNVEEFASTDVFAATVMRIARAADEATNDMKRAALRNALLNTAFRIDPDDDERERFLQLVIDLRPAHLQLLAVLHNPKDYGQKRGIVVPDDVPFGGGVWDIIVIAEPSLAKQAALSKQLQEELMTLELMTKMSLGGGSTGRGFSSRSYTTDVGKRFIEFISTPKVLTLK